MPVTSSFTTGSWTDACKDLEKEGKFGAPTGACPAVCQTPAAEKAAADKATADKAAADKKAAADASGGKATPRDKVDGVSPSGSPLGGAVGVVALAVTAIVMAVVV